MVNIGFFSTLTFLKMSRKWWQVAGGGREMNRSPNVFFTLLAVDLLPVAHKSHYR